LSLADYRLIVAGSREYDDHLALRTALNEILEKIPPRTTLVVVHGGHPNPDYSTQADRIAQEWAIERAGEGEHVREEPWPADWTGPCRDTCEEGHREMVRGASICPAAGPYRTQAMVAYGARRGLVALRVGTKSTGSRLCARLMLAAGIPFEFVVQGNARGLPRDLLAMGDQQESGG
jgi:hypothetical protein